MGKRADKSTDEKLRTVLSVLRGEVTLAEAGRRAGVSDMTVAKWRDRFVEGGTSALAGDGQVRPLLRVKAHVDTEHRYRSIGGNVVARGPGSLRRRDLRPSPSRGRPAGLRPRGGAGRRGDRAALGKGGSRGKR